MNEKNLDYNSTIGLFLILLILTFFTYFNTYNDKEFISNKFLEKRVSLLDKSSFVSKKKSEKDCILENEVLRLRISSLGGMIDEVFLKKYKAYDFVHLSRNKNLYLTKNSSFLYKMIFWINSSKNHSKRNLISTNSLYFHPFFFHKRGKFITLIMRANNPYGVGFIDHIFTLNKGLQYHIGFHVRTVDFPPFTENKTISINLEQKVFSLEKDRNWENTYTQVYYSQKKNSHLKIHSLSEKKSEEKNISDLNWVAYKQQFFATIFIPKKPLKDFFIRSENLSSGIFLKKIQSFMKIKEHKEINIPFQLYFGPLDFYLLKKFDQKIENIIPFGWGFLKWINKYFFLEIFQFLEKTNLNYGVIIILMTIVVKLILSPITYKQYKLSAMMKLIRPEIDEINNKFKNSDPLKKQRAMMELYQKVGINPMSGCFSALFQIPIFYSLFKFFPTLINLRGKSFLWVEDLTSYDSILELPFSIPFYGNHVSLLTLLYSFALLIYTKLSNNIGSNDTLNNQNNASDTSFLLYLMPVIMLFFINSYASGLSLYYFISNIINIGLIFFIKKFLLDENKILQKIQENKKKQKKLPYWKYRIKEIIKKKRIEKISDF